jgi:hypothetical protein
MGSSKPKPVETPFQQQQSQNNTYSYYSPLNSGSPGVSDYLNIPLNFGDSNAYGGEAYKDIKTNFNLDPGVGRRTDLAEQSFQNQSNSAFNAGMPREYRQLLRDSGLRQIRSQGAAEAQQAEYGRQNLEANASLQRAQMRDAAELNKANMGNQIASQGTLANLARQQSLLPQLVQTGGSGSSSGYNTQILPGQQGWFGSLLQGAGSVVGGALAGGAKF